MGRALIGQFNVIFGCFAGANKKKSLMLLKIPTENQVNRNLIKPEQLESIAGTSLQLPS